MTSLLRRTALLGLLLAACAGGGDGSGRGLNPVDRSGSCAGFCGGESAVGCFCDPACAAYGDCCSDVADICRASCREVAAPGADFCLLGRVEPIVDDGGCTSAFRCVPDPTVASCEGRCGAIAPAGCSCAEGCEWTASCCRDKAPVCGASCEVVDQPGPGFCPHGSVEADLDEKGCVAGFVCEVNPADYSCIGRCGGAAPSGCTCERTCHTTGTCCADVSSFCQVDDARYTSVGSLRDQALIDELNRLIGNHTSFTYDQARGFLLRDIDVHGGQVECVYTGRRVDADDTLSPGGFQTEHSWPQSQGAKELPARSDMHHLFPADGQANLRRSNYPFGMTDCDLSASCSWESGGSALGPSINGGGTVFEVRQFSRGNIARALFYFSVRYRMPIADDIESVLRTWHHADPPDAAEQTRNDAIAVRQHNRNPFVDRQEFVDRIANF